MAVDYVFVGMIMTFLMGMTFMILGFEKVGTGKEYPMVIIYHFLAFISFLPLGQFALMSTSYNQIGLPIWMLFFGFALINLIFFMVMIWQVFNMYKTAKMEKEEEEE